MAKAQTQVKQLFQGMDIQGIASAGFGAGLTSYVPGKIVAVAATGGQKAMKLIASMGTAALSGVLVNGVTKNKRDAQMAVAAGLGITVIQGLAMYNIVQIGGASPIRQLPSGSRPSGMPSPINRYPAPATPEFEDVRLS